MLRELVTTALNRTGLLMTGMSIGLGAVAGFVLSQYVHVAEGFWENAAIWTLFLGFVGFLIDLLFVSPLRLLSNYRRALADAAASPGGITFTSPVTVGQMTFGQGGIVNAGPADEFSQPPARRPLPEDQRPWLDAADVHRGRFTGLSVQLTDLIPWDGNAIIAGKTFVDCTIYGPAIVVPQAAFFEGVRFEVNLDVRSILFPLTPERAALPVVGPILVAHCRFLGQCRFVGVGFMGMQEEMDQMLEAIPMLPPRSDGAG